MRAFVTNPLMLDAELFYSLGSNGSRAKLERKANGAIVSKPHHVAAQIQQSPANVAGLGNKYLRAVRINGKDAGIRWNNRIDQQVAE